MKIHSESPVLRAFGRRICLELLREAFDTWRQFTEPRETSKLARGARGEAAWTLHQEVQWSRQLAAEAENQVGTRSF